MKIKKLLAVALSATMLFSLAGCGSDSSSEKAESTSEKKITIWAWDDSFNVKAANLAKEAYQKNNKDVEVEVVSMAQDDIVQKLNTSLSSGQTSGLPNIVLIEDYRIQYYLNSFPEALKDLSDYVKASDFSDFKTKVNQKDGKIYGVPFDSGVASLFYRTDYIEKAGYTIEDMKDITWDKFIEIGKAVKKATGKSMLTLDPSDLGQIRMMLQSAGSWYVKDDGSTVNLADNDVLKEAIKTYKAIVDSGISTQISGWDPFVSAFQKGDVASVPTGCWIASSITAAKDQSGKWAAAPLPRLENVDNATNYSNIGGAGWYVLDKVGNSDLAAEFLSKTFASDTALLNDLVSEINLVSTFNKASETENYAKKNEYFSNQEIFKDFAEWTTKVPAVNYGLYTYTIEDLLTESVQAIMNGADIDETLKNAQATAESAVVS